MTFHTIGREARGLYRSRGSRFIAYARRLDDEDELSGFLDELRSAHPKARHFCYGYRIGVTPDRYRANDDGEPNHSAGRPILGQIDSTGLTNVLVVVVRYFGGTKLGIPGLIEAYKCAAAEALAAAGVAEVVIERRVRIRTDYAHLPELMSAVKTQPWRTVRTEMDTAVEVVVAVPAADYADAYAQLWRVLAKAYPGEEALDRSPDGYDLTVLD